MREKRKNNCVGESQMIYVGFTLKEESIPTP